jgi:glycosyltransferase involved in cell wall biosynthesis
MWYRDFQAVTGACLMVARTTFEALGGFDEVYQIGYSDLELCLRIRQRGGSVLYTPFARLIHHEGGTRGLYLPHFDVMRASCQLTPGSVAGDPFYNPNLSRVSRTPELARPDEPSTVAAITTILQHYELLPGQVDAAPLAGALLCVAPPAPWPLPAQTPPPSQRRLLLVTHDLSLSGAPILLWGLARRLRRAGYAVRVLSAKDGPLHDDYRALGCEVIVRPDLLEQLENALLIAEAVAGCDGVIANTILAWRAIHTGAAYALPTAWWLHESRFGLNYAQAHAGAAAAFAVANLVIFPSHFQAELFGALRRPANSCVIHYGLPDAPSIHSPDAAALPARRLRALHIGSLESRKGQDILLQAVALLPPAVAAVVEFALIGRVIEPAYAAEIEGRVQQLTGAEQGAGVQLLGELPRQAVLAQLAEADIFLLTSRDEVLPVTLLEAMSLGKAIAAAAVAGVPEAIEDGVSGLLFPTGDPAMLARQIERLVTDADLRFSLGQHAMQTAAGRFAEEENLGVMLAAIETSFGWEQRAAP